MRSPPAISTNTRRGHISMNKGSVAARQPCLRHLYALTPLRRRRRPFAARSSVSDLLRVRHSPRTRDGQASAWSVRPSHSRGIHGRRLQVLPGCRCERRGLHRPPCLESQDMPRMRAWFSASVQSRVWSQGRRHRSCQCMPRCVHINCTLSVYSGIRVVEKPF
jgi:hypothetical protein